MFNATSFQAHEYVLERRFPLLCSPRCASLPCAETRVLNSQLRVRCQTRHFSFVLFLFFCEEPCLFTNHQLEVIKHLKQNKLLQNGASLQLVCY